ncbi:NAD(P)-binding protein [Streptomyces sp. NBC_00582]|uniref:NAD(P)-binding protein n=1 Tax=Streptomyces sp. NBC_00582 TaxID=2975783 RepID=UPI002E823C68|nr:NAD(P)-binding protein [Streptomyces sp. NBC_00582]WUB67470.1 NAD(P)-binding protein [Streptomyces sp. NBC_00582]
MSTAALLPIAILGAGIGGLAAAGRLRAEGCDVEVYDQAAVKRERCAALGLRASTVRILEDWGLDGTYESYVYPFDARAAARPAPRRDPAHVSRDVAVPPAAAGRPRGVPVATAVKPEDPSTRT